MHTSNAPYQTHAALVAMMTLLFACSPLKPSKSDKDSGMAANAPQGAADATSSVNLQKLACDCERLLALEQRAGYSDSIGSLLPTKKDCSYIHPDGDSQTFLTIEIYQQTEQHDFEALVKTELSVDAIKSRSKGGGEIVSQVTTPSDQGYNFKALYWQPSTKRLLRLSEKQSYEANQRGLKPVGARLGDLLDHGNTGSLKHCQ